MNVFILSSFFLLFFAFFLNNYNSAVEIFLRNDGATILREKHLAYNFNQAVALKDRLLHTYIVYETSQLKIR